MTKVLADALVPIFFGLLLGYIAGLRGLMDNQNIKTLITFVMSFAVPSSLFLALARTPRAALREQAATALLLAIVFGRRATITVATSIAIGSITASPLTLAILEGSRRDSREASTLMHIGISLIRSFKKPIVYAPVLGLALSCIGFNPPSYIDRSFAVMGSTADGSALVLTGLVVSAQKFEIRGGTLVAVLLKNVIQPTLAIGIAMLIHLSIEETRYVTLISALPCGFFGVVFGRDFNSNPRLASSSLIASYVVGVGTLAAWIVIVNHLG